MLGLITWLREIWEAFGPLVLFRERDVNNLNTNEKTSFPQTRHCLNDGNANLASILTKWIWRIDRLPAALSTVTAQPAGSYANGGVRSQCTNSGRSANRGTGLTTGMGKRVGAPLRGDTAISWSHSTKAVESGGKLDVELYTCVTILFYYQRNVKNLLIIRGNGLEDQNRPQCVIGTQCCCLSSDLTSKLVMYHYLTYNTLLQWQQRPKGHMTPPNIGHPNWPPDFINWASLTYCNPSWFPWFVILDQTYSYWKQPNIYKGQSILMMWSNWNEWINSSLAYTWKWNFWKIGNGNAIKLEKRL